MATRKIQSGKYIVTREDDREFTIWKGYCGRWIIRAHDTGSLDDAPTLKCAKMGLENYWTPQSKENAADE